MRFFLTLAWALLLCHHAYAKPSPQLVVQRGHNGAITSSAFSPDGRLLATGGEDATARIWDARTGLLRRVLAGHDGHLGLVKFLRDGRLVTGEGHQYSYQSAGVVRFWNARTGQLLLTRSGPGATRVREARPEDEFKRYIVAVTISPDGRLIARASVVIDSDRRIQSQILVTVQDVASAKMLRPLRAPTQRIGTLLFSPDSRVLAATGWQSPVLVWDVATAKLKRRLAETQTYSRLAFSPDGSRLACSVMQDGKTRNALHIWDLSSGKQAQRFLGTGSQNGTLQFSRSGVHLISGDYGQIRFWNTRTGAVDATFAMSSEAGIAMALAPDERFVVGTGAGRGERRGQSDDGAIRLWDVRARRLLWSRDGAAASQSHTSARMQRDGKTLQVQTSDGSVRLWALPGLQPQRDYKAAQKEHIVALSLDGKLLVVRMRLRDPKAFPPDVWQIRDAATGAARFTVPAASGGYEWSTGGFFSHDSTLLVETSMSDAIGAGGIRVWDATNGQPVIIRREIRAITAVAFSPDDRLLALGDYGGAITLWNARTGAALGGTALGSDPVTALAFSTARQLAASNGKSAARLWDIQGDALTPSETQPAQLEFPTLLAFSPDGSLLAGSDNSAITIWSLRGGQKLHRIPTAPSAIVSLDFPGDGRHVVAGGRDGSVQFWRVADGEGRLSLWPKLQPDSPEWIAVTPQGFYTGSSHAEDFIAWQHGAQVLDGASLQATHRSARNVALALGN